MKYFTWDDGRQLSGYRKMALAISKRFKFDAYVIKIPDGCGIPKHKDLSIPGFEHHRINIELKRGCFAGQVRVKGPFERFLFGRGMYFRPDKYVHWMTPHSFIEGSSDSTYLLSIGWLRVSKETQIPTF